MLKNLAWIPVAFMVATPLAANAEEDYAIREYRQAIPVTAKERNLVLFEMREILHSLVNMYQALARDDYEAAASVAQPLVQMNQNIPDSLRERFPEQYQEISIGMRESFQSMINNAFKNKDMSAVHVQLAESMTYCSGCHDAYRFEVRKTPPGRN